MTNQSEQPAANKPFVCLRFGNEAWNEVATYATAVEAHAWFGFQPGAARVEQDGKVLLEKTPG